MPITICLWTLKSEFHVSQNSIIIVIFQPLKNVNIIFSFQVIQKLAAGCYLPAGHSLPSLGLRHHRTAYTYETKYKYMYENKSNNILHKGLKYYSSKSYGSI